MSINNRNLQSLFGLNLSFLVCVIAPVNVQADWPEFRGPSAQGIVSGRLSSDWTVERNLIWKYELPGEGWSSPVVSGGRIFLTAAIPGDSGGYKLVLLTLDAETGALSKQVDLFDQPQEAPPIHRKNSHASPTPVIEGQYIYLHFGHQGTACCRFDGSVVWRNSDLGYQPVHGNGGSPVVAGNLLIFSRDGSDISEVTALDKQNGKLIWQRERGLDVKNRFSFCTPLLLEHSGRRQLVIPGSNVVQSLDPETGEELWRVRYTGYSVVPRPIYHSGLIYMSTGFDLPRLLAIDPSGQGDVTESHVRWTYKLGVPSTPSLIGWQSYVVMISDIGILSCLKAETGELAWKTRLDGHYSSSPILAGNRLLAINESGVCTVVELTESQANIEKRIELGERTLASPAMIGNDLLIRTDKALYRIAQ